MTTTDNSTTPDLWARFRFSIVGSLLSAPPAHGQLMAAIRSLAARTWTHPVTGRDVRFAASTIERWYYRARGEKHDPIRVLRRRVRNDCDASIERSEVTRSSTSGLCGIWISTTDR